MDLASLQRALPGRAGMPGRAGCSAGDEFGSSTRSSPFKLLQEDVEVQALLGVQKSDLETPL